MTSYGLEKWLCVCIYVCMCVRACVRASNMCHDLSWFSTNAHGPQLNVNHPDETYTITIIWLNKHPTSVCLLFIEAQYQFLSFDNLYAHMQWFHLTLHGSFFSVHTLPGNLYVVLQVIAQYRHYLVLQYNPLMSFNYTM